MTENLESIHFALASLLVNFLKEIFSKNVIISDDNVISRIIMK